MRYRGSIADLFLGLHISQGVAWTKGRLIGEGVGKMIGMRTTTAWNVHESLLVFDSGESDGVCYQ